MWHSSKFFCGDRRLAESLWIVRWAGGNQTGKQDDETRRKMSAEAAPAPPAGATPLHPARQTDRQSRHFLRCCCCNCLQLSHNRAAAELEVACFLRARDACIVRGFLMTCTGGCPTCTCTDDDSFSRLASAAFTAGSLPMRWKFPVGRNLQRNSSVSNCWRQLILRF